MCAVCLHQPTLKLTSLCCLFLLLPPAPFHQPLPFLQCLPKAAAPQAKPAAATQAGSVAGVETNPAQLAKDLSCNCPRAVTAAKAVSAALAKSGNACGSSAGQALAQAFSQAYATGQGTAISQALASAKAYNAQQVGSTH